METSDFVSDPGYASELSNSLYQLQQSGHLIDTFIKTKTGGINAHKIVLFANGGPFLQEQISRTVSLDTTMCNIDLSHVLHEDVLALITYLYTGKLKISGIESDSCLKLFQFLEIDLEKLKGNTTTAAMEKGVSIESECEDKDKSGDKDDQMDSNKLKDSPEKSDSGDSENESFEIEISNMQEGEVEERSDFVGQVQIFDETTGELVKLEDVKIKPPAVRGKKKRLASAKKRKKEPVPLAEKRKRKAVPIIEETKKIQVESANKRKSPRTKKKETVNSVEDQQNETLESSPSSSEINKVLLEEGTICSECSLDVRECVCEFSPSMDTMTCMRCHIRYTTKEDFIKHREEKHSLRCGMCDFKITRGSNLVSHMLEKHGISSNQLETGYTVKQEKTTDKQKGDNDEIPVSTETNNTLVTMETTTNEKTTLKPKEKGKGKKRYLCTVCTYSTLCCSNLKRHMKTHQPKVKYEEQDQFVCDQCGKQFVSRYGLNLHNRTIHKKTFKFVCETCGKGFNQKFQFTNHCRKHIRLTIKFCPICKEKCPSHDSLIEHFESCHQKTDLDPDQEQFRCKFCLTLCASKKALYSHVKGKHEPPTYFCKHCDSKYRWRSSLKAHLKFAHNLQNLPYNIDVAS